MWLFHQVDASHYQLYDVIPCSESELRPPTHYRYWSVFCRFLYIAPGREVEGWQEGQDKPSAEVQVSINCLKCLWDPSLSWPLSYKHSQHSGLADHHPLLGDSQEPSLELSSLESNAIRFCEIMKRSQHILTQPCSSNVSSSGMEMGSQLGANSLIDEQL